MKISSIQQNWAHNFNLNQIQLRTVLLKTEKMILVLKIGISGNREIIDDQVSTDIRKQICNSFFIILK